MNAYYSNNFKSYANSGRKKAFDELYVCTAGTITINLIVDKLLAYLCLQFWCSPKKKKRYIMKQDKLWCKSTWKCTLCDLGCFWFCLLTFRKRINRALLFTFLWSWLVVCGHINIRRPIQCSPSETSQYLPVTHFFQINNQIYIQRHKWHKIINKH